MLQAGNGMLQKTRDNWLSRKQTFCIFPPMEFGRLETDELDSVDFTLPPDLPETDRVLANELRVGAPAVFVGCAKWGRKDWIGKIYPEKTKEADFLSHYGKHFNCIELNATFYKMPSVSQTASWASKVGTDFQFSPKFPNQITHMRRLKNVEELTTRFLQGISGFGDRLGPLFLMPHPQLGPKDLDRLEAFIQSLPEDVKVFVELRHPEWYADRAAFEALFSMMERHRAGSIITDASGRRDCVHMRLSTPEAFIRFVGNGLHPTDYTRIDDWVQRIKLWISKGIHTVYFFMHQHEEIYSPELCRYLIIELNKHCGTTIPVPVFVAPPVRGVSATLSLFDDKETPAVEKPPSKRSSRTKAGKKDD
jgi:uncharacterized protein YecE (DUF72 family)